MPVRAGFQETCRQSSTETVHLPRRIPPFHGLFGKIDRLAPIYLAETEIRRGVLLDRICLRGLYRDDGQGAGPSVSGDPFHGLPGAKA